MLPNRLVIGAEVDASFPSFQNLAGISIGGTSTFSAPSIGAESYSETVLSSGTVRGRIGYALGNWLLYATGGFAWTYDQLTLTQLATGTTASPFLWRFGWAAGAGAEVPVAPHWNAFMVVFRALNASATCSARDHLLRGLGVDLVRGRGTPNDHGERFDPYRHLVAPGFQSQSGQISRPAARPSPWQPACGRWSDTHTRRLGRGSLVLAPRLFHFPQIGPDRYLELGLRRLGRCLIWVVRLRPRRHRIVSQPAMGWHGAYTGAFGSVRTYGGAWAPAPAPRGTRQPRRGQLH
jgi:hypothetical protein